MSELFLFSQLPTNTKFRFEQPHTGPVFVKSSEAGAHHDGAFQKVNPGVLVFPVPIPTEVTLRLNNSYEFLAVKLPDKTWMLVNNDGPSQYFNTLEDIIHHLES